MTKIFKIEMLPALHGDAIWIEYGEEQDPRRILIDGGPENSYEFLKDRVVKLKENNSEFEFELIIVTHIDTDHIEGILKLLEDPAIDLKFKDMWFNGWNHLLGSAFEEFGPKEGERLRLILKPNIHRWNKKFNHHRIVVPNSRKPPIKNLEGDIELTVLSPFYLQLKQLKPKWIDDCKKAGLDPRYKKPEQQKRSLSGFEAMGPNGPINVETLANSKYKRDPSKANGSSIAVLIEYKGRKVLLAGDARPDVLLRSIEKINKITGAKRLDLNAFKLPHHGSRNNINKAILEIINCQNFLISTNGDIYGHPDNEAIARIIKFRKEHKNLIFNYDYSEDENFVWNDQKLKDDYDYETKFPSKPNNGNSIIFKL